ncbi:glycine--tRNA ligase subunit alpha/beta [Candidatus Poribacteria bacterium]|nr:glycine--tRNA ligase subunit alpha/beta [Candidatus Poribacteria bacterium]
MTFQQIIEALDRYWSERGCLIQQPYDIEVGAGTFNPATSLRCLGPEPFNVAYVEPSRRPTDGRYGENPYKIGHYYQYQVIMKPAPFDSQDMYLGSLEALGLDLRGNDMRFVEDDWESPTLGASGLGWEVWCNGAEVTQYTYFQQMGSVELDPICVELTYGLERVAMYLQNVDSIFDVQWNDTLTYRDVHHQTEVDYTTYYLECSTPELLLKWFDDYERESRVCIDGGLVWPALDYVLKASHAFNMLDARGSISVSERAGYIARVRNLSRRVAQAYVAQRAELSHPLLPPPDSVKGADASPPAVLAAGWDADLLLEIGVEEVPASYIEPALAQLREDAAAWLGEAGLTHGDIRTMATPRRLTLHVASVQARQEDAEVEASGPPKRAAYDDSGAPTKAALGFARGQGVDVEDLFTRETERGEYVFARKNVEGRASADLLAEFLPGLITGLRFPKSMRWGGLRFARPIRWIVALLGDAVVNFELDEMHSGRTTQGHRFLGGTDLAVASADLAAYEALLDENSVIVDPAKRRARIVEQTQAALRAEGSPDELDQRLVDEVNYLVECPTPVVGTLGEAILELPPQVLITAMRKDQRCFPVYNADGALQPKFIATSNSTAGGEENVRHGNERVLRARLENAAFFWQEDLKTTIGDRVDDLRRVTFQERLGSLHDKVGRVGRLAAGICADLGMSTEAAAHAARAAELAKADLTTQMVFEFAELQGTMGKLYALHAGEPRAVADAVEQHYLPDSAEADLPQSDVATVVSLADKLDTIAGYFGIGQVPTGSADPYSLRRQAIGVCRILLDKGLDLDLDTLLRRACEEYEAEAPLEALQEFFRARLEALLEDRGHAYDAVDAVLSSGFSNVAALPGRLAALETFRASAAFLVAYPALNRVLRILPDGVDAHGPPKEALFQDDAERDLARVAQDDALASAALEDLTSALASMQPQIDAFFDAVLVMDTDDAVRNNRLALLSVIGRRTLRLGDITKLVIAGE